jgi:hypothetical protein
LTLPDCQSSLSDPQTGLPGLGSKLVGKNIEAGILQSLLLHLKGDLTIVESGHAGSEAIELMVEREVV